MKSGNFSRVVSLTAYDLQTDGNLFFSRKKVHSHAPSLVWLFGCIIKREEVLHISVLDFIMKNIECSISFDGLSIEERNV